jgi:hypothetical protein
MKKFLMALAAVGLVAAWTIAAEEGAAGAAKEGKEAKKGEHHGMAPDLSKAADLTVTGTLAKEEGAHGARFSVTTAAGDKVNLPAVKPDSGIDLAAMVGKSVTVSGKGMEKEKDGKKTIRILKIEKVEEAKAEAPAAPAAAPVAPAAPAK